MIIDKLILKLIYEWTNKDLAAQGRIVGRTSKETHWSMILAEESTDYMKKVAYQITSSAVQGRLEDLRTVKTLADKFGDILKRRAIKNNRCGA